jgi:ring-1,2-phenylacetyl-CoA epoxidase subunit PaaC
VLAIADDCLIYSHRLAECATRAPELEEDVALANLALDLLGQARLLLADAVPGRTEDDLAYLRTEREFTNCQLVELPNGDFAHTIARLLCFSTYQLALWETLLDSPLGPVAAKAVKEAAYHRDHAAQWTVRLGDGTPQSHDRMQAGLAAVWPYTYELFDDDGQAILRSLAGAPVELLPGWSSFVGSVLGEATLEVPPDDGWHPTGGRRGLHTESFGYLVAEMQSVHRAHPGADW